MAIMALSKRSNMPPCPGKILPESLIPSWRFMSDSVKSPHVPKTTTVNANPAHSAMDKNGKKWAKTNEDAIAKMPPPMLPSHDFLGEMRSKSLCLPSREPTQYAPESLSQIKTKSDNGKIGL